MPESANRAFITGKIEYLREDLLGRGELRCTAITAEEARLLEEEKRRKDEAEEARIRALFPDDDDPPAAQHPSESSAPPPDDSADDLWREQPVLLHGKLWSWSERGEGVVCVLLPVFDAAGKVFDALAWRREFPDVWYRQTGLVTHLGEKALRDSQWGPSPRIIRLYENPAAWLAASSPALCIVDWSIDLRSLFGGVEQIHCTTAKLAKKLEEQFARQVHHGFSIKVRP